MGVASTQGLSFRLVANDVALDLFKDEEIKVSDNVTGLFDVGELPSDFTRTITLPGTKKKEEYCILYVPSPSDLAYVIM